MQAESTTGLSSRTAAVLTYLGWWVTGVIFWAIERRDPFVRFHAIQSTVAFGTLALLIAAFGLLALVMLSYAPSAFTLFMSAALGLSVVGVALWLVALWHASQGKYFRIPLAARMADRARRAELNA